MNTLIANLKQAARTQTAAHIGGGIFSPTECAALAAELEKLQPANPGACFSTQAAGYEITLTQQSKNRFTVVYGLHKKARLDYSSAAKELGECLMHAAACDGLLNNGA